VRSTCLEKANLVCLLSETSSAKHNLVLSDEADIVGANSAMTGIFAVLSWV
jgi:hypothetical protein